MISLESISQEEIERFLAELKALTAIDSGTHNQAGVNAVGEVIAQRLAGLGADISRYPGGDAGDCIAGILRGAGTARIMLVGHLDTVYPDGVAAERPLRIEGNRAYGPGACDMKGGLLVGLYALQKLRQIGFDDFAELIFFCSSDEETGSVQSRPHLLPLAAGADAALVLEAGWPKGRLPMGAVTSARKGAGRFKLYVTGREAHAGTEFERGASANLALARKIEALHGLTGRWPEVTVNVGVIRGGTVHNTVSGQAYAEVDLRVKRRQDIEPLENACRDIAARVDLPGTSARIEGGIGAPPMERSPAVGRLVELAQAEAGALGFSLTEHASGGASDASYIAAQGTPALDGLGPVGAQDHSPDEYLLIDSLAPRIALLARLITTITHSLDRKSSGRPLGPLGAGPRPGGVSG